MWSTNNLMNIKPVQAENSRLRVPAPVTLRRSFRVPAIATYRIQPHRWSAVFWSSTRFWTLFDEDRPVGCWRKCPTLRQTTRTYMER